MLRAYTELSLQAFASIFAHSPLFGQRGWRLSALFDQMVAIGVATEAATTTAEVVVAAGAELRCMTPSSSPPMN